MYIIAKRRKKYGYKRKYKFMDIEAECTDILVAFPPNFFHHRFFSPSFTQHSTVLPIFPLEIGFQLLVT
jgi:hypothetical protein